MVKPNLFEISFCRPDAIYYPGDVMVGHVTVELIDPMKIKGIKVKFAGKASTHIEEERKNRTAHFWGKEKYFDSTEVLFDGGSDESSKTCEMQTGRHTFPFEFQLPGNIPCSFESEHGQIRYCVSCTIEKFGTFEFNNRTSRMFTVNRSLDLNDIEGVTRSDTEREEEYLCCCCCRSGPISGEITIMKKGYVPGEAVKIYGHVRNGTSRTINKTYVKLIMWTKVAANYKVDFKKKEVARVSRGRIPGYGQDSWNGEHLVIPPLPPSYLEGCRIIDQEYYLVLTISPSGPSFDVETAVEIVIGTIPLRSTGETYAEPAWAGSCHAPAYPGPPIRDIPDIPPPSYYECITGRVQIQDDNTTGDSISFAPAYAYYDMGHGPAPHTQTSSF